VKNYLQENKHNRVRPEEPLFSADELNGIIPVDHKKPLNMYHVLARVLDVTCDSFFGETARAFPTGAKTVIAVDFCSSFCSS